MQKVLRDYRSTTLEPVIFEKGESIEIKRRASEWSGWKWCIKKDGKRGWVPKSFIEFKTRYTGILKRNYYCFELDVNFGDQVEIIDKESGWSFCEKDGIRGWVPDVNLKPRKKKVIKDETKTVRKRF